MKKPTVYLDTNVISAYWYEGQDVIAFSRRIQTREWWEIERYEFDVWISPITIQELQGGKYRRQEDACVMVEKLRVLTVNRQIVEFSKNLIQAGIVPGTKPNDALQMAVASVHQIDYLLTWNYAHLANPQAQHDLEQFSVDNRVTARR